MNLSQLKHDSTVQMKTHYTTKEAIENIPKLNNPESVTDVLFQVGLNDFRRGYKAKEIQENTLMMQIAYHKAFPNARQHLTALPPLANGHKSVSTLLQRLSTHTESNFVSTKVFTDGASGKLRAKTMDGIHYSDFGIRLLAKEMKKSLYSSSNKNSQRLSTLCAFTNDADSSDHRTVEKRPQEVVETSGDAVEINRRSSTEGDDDEFEEDIDDDVFADSFDDYELLSQLCANANNAISEPVINTGDIQCSDSFDWLH